MGYGQTAYNRLVCVAPPSAAWPTEKRRTGLLPG
jgi:hypothetical protein